MWQTAGTKPTAKFHYLLDAPEHGSVVVHTLCGKKMAFSERASVPYVDRQEFKCPICSDVASVLFTSVDDARSSIQFITNSTSLQRALALSTRVTLDRLLERRLRELAKGG